MKAVRQAPVFRREGYFKYELLALWLPASPLCKLENRYSEGDLNMPAFANCKNKLRVLACCLNSLKKIKHIAWLHHNSYALSRAFCRC